MTKHLLLFIVCCLTSWTASAQLSTITSVQLEFEANGRATVTATASDSGNGLAVDGSINLSESTEYTLSITLFNGDSDITSEVTANADELQFFFDPSEDLLEDGPSYNDMDGNMLPLGLSSSLTGNCVSENDITGTFRVALKDLGNQKTANSTIDDGSSIFDLNWTINIVDDPNAPACENEEEVIDKVTLTFTPVDGGDPVVAIASDPDGPGPMDLVTEEIELLESTEYQLAITLESTIEGEDITAEIMEEDDEHLFLFAFGENVFESPDGDGNIDNIADPVNYADQDDNGLPIGLLTNWTTACTGDHDHGGEEEEESFRVVLKHQPDLKTATSGFDVGGTDLDITWDIHIMDDPNAPACENEEEVIDKVTLTFTPVDGGDPVVAIASDPDGPGPMDLVTEEIELLESTEYQLAITLESTIEGEDITAEIMEEDDEHLFLFAFGENVFESPDGDGNIDNIADPVNYADQDDNGLPIGLLTNWTTACTGDHDHGGEEEEESFRVVLKHQPDLKTATSGFDVGGTDLDITWDIHIMDDPNAPACENEEEVIDKVTLTFTPVDGGDPVVAIASDPDGPGPMDLMVEDIDLVESTEYELSITVENTIEGEDITEEIKEEDDEHMFFFAWTEGIFSDPTGDGNADNRADVVNYNDLDDNSLPVGLSTQWTTSSADLSGTFRLVLKHQPDLKSATSTIDDGGTDLDITWNVNTVVTDINQVIRANRELKVFPNPAQDILNWRVDDTAAQPTFLRIMDQFGRVIGTYSNAQPQINIQDFPKGNYYLQAIDGKHVRTRSFIKL